MTSTPLSLNFDLDTRFAPHRLGTSRLLTLPLECSTVKTSTFLGNPRFFWEGMEAIYNTAGIALWERFFTRRYHYGEDPNSASITLFTIADIVNTSTDTMRAVLTDVQRHCLETGITVDLEVIDSTYNRRRDFTLELSDHEAIQKWDSLSIEILRYFDTTAHKFGCSWSTIDLVRRGASADKTERPITVVIGTPQSTQGFWWDQGIEDIRAMTGDEFVVEILHVASWNAMAEDRIVEDDIVEDPIVKDRIRKDAYEDPLVMGASIGLSGTNGEGTLGGFVKVVRKGQVEACQYAITNHHVAVRSESLRGSVTAFDLTSTTPVHDRPLIVSPADKDDTVHKESLIRRMGYHLEYLNGPMGLRDKLADITSGRRFTMDTTKHTRLEGTIRHHESVVHKLGLEYEEATLYNRIIGRLVAGSGRRLSCLHESTTLARNYPMDWALVAMHSTKGCGNTMHKPLGDADVATTLEHGTLAEEYEIIDPSKERIEVAFRGRTSGWNFGKLNPVHSLVNDKSTTTSDIARIYNITESNPACCWTIAPRTKTHEAIACRKGDSGSVVLRDFKGVTGRWVGLVFGARGDGEVAYVMPIQLVLKDIETTMNGTVIEPTLADGL